MYSSRCLDHIHIFIESDWNKTRIGNRIHHGSIFDIPFTTKAWNNGICHLEDTLNHEGHIMESHSTSALIRIEWEG